MGVTDIYPGCAPGQPCWMKSVRPCVAQLSWRKSKKCHLKRKQDRQLPALEATTYCNTAKQVSGQKNLQLDKSLQSLKDIINRMNDCTPKLHILLGVEVHETRRVCATRRDHGARNLRCLTNFYGFQAETFLLSVSLMDHFATKVKVQPKYLPCVSIACFLLAAFELEETASLPPLAQVLKVSQCTGCSAADMSRMQTIITAKISVPSIAGNISPLTILLHLHATLAVLYSAQFDDATLRLTTSTMSDVACQAELLLAKPTTLALAVMFCTLEELRLTANLPIVSLFILLQDACNVSHAELLHCHEKVTGYLNKLYNSPGRWNKAKKTWSLSARTMASLRPSYYGHSSLPVILEDPTVILSSLR